MQTQRAMVILYNFGETFIYMYNFNTKEESRKWRHSVSPHTKKCRVQKTAEKVLDTVFWDNDSVPLVDYFEHRTSITSNFYTSHLQQLKRTDFQTPQKVFQGINVFRR